MLPQVYIERFVVTHPGCDDNVFWVWFGGRHIQVGAQADGNPPFVLEGDARRADNVNGADVFDLLRDWLKNPLHGDGTAKRP